VAKDSLDTKITRPAIHNGKNHQSTHRYEVTAEWYKKMIEGAEEGFLLFDSSGGIIDVNESLCSMLGYSRREMLSMTVFDCGMGLDNSPEKLVKMVEQLKQLGGVHHSESQLRCKIGIVIDVIGSIQFLDIDSEHIFCFFHDITEHKMLERRVEESERKYRELFDEAPIAYVYVDLEGYIQESNREAQKLLGYTHNELRKIKIYDLHPDELKKAGKLVFKKATQGKIIKNEEVIHLNKSGNKIYCLLSINPLKNDEGKTIALRSTLKDITIRKYIEQQLQESKEFSEKIIRSMKDGFSLLSDKGVQLDVNDAFSQMTGFEREELIGKQPPFPYWPEEEYNRIQEAFQKTLRCEFSDFELVYKRKNGERFPVLVSPYSVVGAGGEVSYFMSTIKDITERKKMTEAVRLEAERLKSLAEIVQYESESIGQLLEFTLEEAIKLTKSKIGYIYFYNEDKKEFILNTWSKDIMKECTIVNPQTVYQLENTGIWGEAVRQSKPIIVNDFQSPHPLKKGYPEGHAEIYKYLTIPVFSQNRIVAVTAVANKETDYNESDTQQLILLMDSVWKAVLRKRAEEELKNQLQQKMEYTRALVHELKTPLTSLQIASDILSEIATANPYLEVSNNISRGVKQLSRRADELLDIAKGEIGLLNLRCRKVNLESFCDGIKEQLIPIANRKGVLLECNMDIDFVSVKMDDERIMQVAYNLFDNALKFTPRGGKIVMSVTSDKENIIISVKDNGCGISKDKIENLFNARKTTQENSQRFSGLGVGLILSKMLVEMHGGELHVESEINKGSTFAFSLPINDNKKTGHKHNLRN